MTNIIKRTTLFVRDIEVSARWYQHVLGLTRWYDDEIVLSGKGLAAGNAGDRVHLIVMRGEDPVLGMIGLLQWLDPPMPAPEGIPDTVTFGSPVFVVASDDVRQVAERAREAGTRIHAEPHEWSVRGADGRTKHFLGISVFDPDGYFFECNQLLEPGA